MRRFFHDEATLKQTFFNQTETARWLRGKVCFSLNFCRVFATCRCEYRSSHETQIFIRMIGLIFCSPTSISEILFKGSSKWTTKINICLSQPSSVGQQRRLFIKLCRSIVRCEDGGKWISPSIYSEFNASTRIVHWGTGRTQFSSRIKAICTAEVCEENENETKKKIIVKLKRTQK